MIRAEYKECVEEVHNDIRLRSAPINVAGDARCDSPGHCALYGTYSLMDTSTSKVLYMQLMKVSNTCLYHLCLDLGYKLST